MHGQVTKQSNTTRPRFMMAGIAMIPIVAIGAWWMASSSVTRDASPISHIGQTSNHSYDIESDQDAHKPIAGGDLVARFQAIQNDRAPRQRAPSAASSNPFPHIPRSRAGLSLEHDPFGAHSVAEQAWLDRHGYPNALQMAEYPVASDEKLQMAADAGDAVARTLLDFRHFESGVEGAEDSLLYAAAMGNSYALELLASFHSGSRRGDPVFGYALSKVLEWQGNYAVSMLREVGMRTPLSTRDRLQAEAEALALFNQILEFRRSTPDAPPSVDPRPESG